MCDKKNSVLFTETKCLVLFPDFKLLDESQVLLKVPRHDNMYNFDLKNVVPSGGLTCLFAKATIDKSNLWHRRLEGKATQSLLFSWVFFLATKDETSGILKTFITGIENQINHKVKIIICDNGIEFKNNDMYQLCGMKGIKRKFSAARTLQQNRVAERKNRTLIEAARTMLADSLLPTIFWAEAVNTACYVKNRVLVTKPHNKTPYELLHGRPPSKSFMRPFRCPVTILNTLDPLGKFDGNADEGFFVGYSINSKAFRVFNTRTRKVEENLHITFLENKPNVEGSGSDWLFDIDLLTNSMNYESVTAGNQTNRNAEDEVADDAGKKSNEKPANEGERNGQENEGGASNKKGYATSTNRVSTVSPSVSTAGQSFDNADPLMPDLEDTADLLNTGIFSGAYDDEDEGAEADLNNLETTMNVSYILTTIIRKDHPKDQIIGDINSATQTRRMPKIFEGHALEPKKVIQALDDPSRIEAMQYELLQFRLQKQALHRDSKALNKDEKREDVDVSLQVTPKTLHSNALKEETRYLKGQTILAFVANSTTEAEYIAAANCYGQVKLQIASIGLLNSSEALVLRGRKAKRTTEIAQLSGTYIHLVADETVTKEREDIMERAATTASSLEVVVPGAKIPYWRVQKLKLAILFWQTATANTLDSGEVQITATIDVKVKLVSKASIRRHLKLEDSDGITTFPNTEIFKQLTLMGSPTYTNVADEAAFTSVDVVHRGASTTVSSIDAGQGSGNIPKSPTMPHDSPLPGGHTPRSDEDSMTLHELMVKKLEQTVKTSQARRRAKIVVSDDEESSRDTSKQGTMIEDIDQDAGISLVTPTKVSSQEDQSEDQLGVLSAAKVLTDAAKKNVNTYTRRRRAVSTGSEGVSTASRIFSTAEESVSTAGASMPVSTAGMVQQVNIIIPSLSETTKTTKDKGKSLMQESEQPKKIKKRVQIQMSLDEELAQKLHKEQARFNAEQEAKFNAEQEELLAIQIQADEDLAQKLLEEERENLSIEERARLLAKLIDKRKKLQAAQRYEVIRNKPQTMSQQRKTMCTYMKNMAGYKMEHFKGKSFYEVKEMFDNVYKQVTSFVPMGSVMEKEEKEQNFDRVDLDKLWSLVKERFSSTDPTDDKERTLWVELKRLFEPDTDDILWKLQRYMHDPLTWRLYDPCGVHHVSTYKEHDIFILVEKDYPLIRGLLTLMLCNKLQVDQYSEMADELLRKIVILANRPRQ
ncbi:putative ribonuclease H-like domain-containing protein [Tanacetum coccineum]